ncbi:hypothetical protein SAMN05216388_100630 [Halorientalis persicus]|jgi:hypothetical protein|uniref:Uncharacterized protein n=1 Tax=Halorientalis persicus TaxID=1367881 RepID=A0A1H8KES9_9EURY|nr:hypothetical protein [Halorientalis persicus]SEN91066.1 hypothetical protein SAMN05216388_100630 [Halorientalis persicus]
MEQYEEAYLEAILENLSTSMAQCLREGDPGVELVRNRSQLTDSGRFWVCDYVTSRLSMVRVGEGGNPNLTADDLDRVREVVGRHESAIAEQLYS